MGTPTSRQTVRKLLKKHGLGQRKARKKKSLGNHPDRDTLWGTSAQFQNIAKLKASYQAASDPVISMDTKKKELIGNFAGEGKVTPHCLYDVARNEGYIHLNTSHDTSKFCCDSVAYWWKQQGCK